MTKSTYRQVWDGDWEPLETDFHLACCDCGLVHHVRIRVAKDKPEIQFVRETRRTGQLRRHMKKGNR